MTGRAGDPYDVLGVARDATNVEVHAAWRRLCTIYHPDRYAEGAPDVREEVERRMAEANDAYARIKRERSALPELVSPEVRVVAPIEPAGAPPSAAPVDAARVDAARVDAAPVDVAPDAAKGPPPRRRRASGAVIPWAASLLVGIAVALVLEGVIASGGRPASLVRERTLRPPRPTAAGVVAPCPPSGDVFWITASVSAEATPAVTSTLGTTFEIAATGRVENRTTTTVEIDPFVELSDAEDRRGVVAVAVHFLDDQGGALADSPTLAPGAAATWVLHAAIELRGADGSPVGTPVEATPVANGVALVGGGRCSFSARTDGIA